MIADNPSTHDLFDALEKTLHTILAESSGGLKVADSHDSGTRTLKIISDNPDSAPINIVLDREFGAYVNVGKASIFEIPFGGKRYTTKDFVDEITTLISGVVSSGFEEEVFVSKGKIVGAAGVIKQGGQLTKDVSETWRKVTWNFFSKPQREHYTYEPHAKPQRLNRG